MCAGFLSDVCTLDRPAPTSPDTSFDGLSLILGPSENSFFLKNFLAALRAEQKFGRSSTRSEIFARGKI